MSDTQPPLDFFLTSSATGLESFELSRMNRAANLRKELRQIMEEWIEAEVNARFARWVLESRRTQTPASHIDLLARTVATAPRLFEQLPISFLPAHEEMAASLLRAELATSGSSGGVLDPASEIIAPTGAVPACAERAVPASPITSETEGLPRMPRESFPCNDDSQLVRPGVAFCASHAGAPALASVPPPEAAATISNAPPLDELTGEFADESSAEFASALERCAQRGDVFQCFGYAAPRPPAASQPSRTSVPVVLRQKLASVSARSFASRRCVHAVA